MNEMNDEMKTAIKKMESKEFFFGIVECSVVKEFEKKYLGNGPKVTQIWSYGRLKKSWVRTRWKGLTLTRSCLD